MLSQWDGSSPCDNCDKIFTIDSVPVYLNDNNLYIAVFPIPNTNNHFVFREHAEFFSHDVPWYQNPTVLFILALTSCVIFVLCIAIYLPLRQLQKQTYNFQQVQMKFGDGKLAERANEKLPAPVGHLAKSFNKMANEIESRVIQSQIFAQAIPHEVRTPLSRIQLVNDLLRMKSQPTEAALHDDIDLYIEDINNLTTSIIMLSKLTSMESSFYETHRSNLNLSTFIPSRLAAHPHHNLTVSTQISEDIVVRCDSTMARLVVDNLIKNAIKYTHTSVKISLIDHDTHLELSVEDDGSGIPESKRKEIFMPFARLDKSRNSKTGGFGLGLAITHAAITRLEWAIDITLSDMNGANFTVIIPKSSNLD
ncbi:ATP-binding protein [Aliivibrio sp. S4TY2]|uniref:ATP-binding protein n=1 Tax=unclassified Aliivibrio TaxID=2645654 RepID=UPI002378BA35|nr:MULTISPECIES: ATP-binding protein [unclassified Aliivibrio]MDD9158219.1 ATP-binding protein [Aliivibrio sp. S4TY2]MDD9162134.1 ATP-binding protein [Aliivibrio sp. S4TY1]MDD9166172.1 ATP-binding protein [Aliivibrio sp. S4MY2]MDD9170170.1 ATP-binding protein [Aliivibrio sp. S4MY4]MDD9187185.1 ATP-binding protein [Aliivibrio sp. S4MY3]